MELKVLNGTSRINGYTSSLGLNNTARVDGTARINGMSKEDLAEYYISKAMGDQSAMNGAVGFFGAKAKERRANRTARRQDKKGRKGDRKESRDRRRAARTEAIERGEGFFQKAAGALANFGEASKVRAQAEVMAAEDGFDVQFDDMAVADIASGAMELRADAGAEPNFFEQYKMPLLIGGGLLAAGGIYLATRPKKKGRRR